MTDRSELTPGSQAAWDHGCICPVMDNAGGRGVTLSTGVFFWINGACPIHGKPEPADAPRSGVSTPVESPPPGAPQNNGEEP